MQFTYDNSKLEKAIGDNDYKWISKKIGFQMAKSLKNRLNQLKASNDFSIYLNTGLGNPHPLSQK